MSKQAIVISLVFLLLLILAGVNFTSTNEQIEPQTEETVEITEVAVVPTTTSSIIGDSVNGLGIETHTFGTGETDLLFVGGVHGGYEWNSILLAYKMIDYLKTNPSLVPDNITLHIIPNLNPDGLFLATGITGEFIATDIPNNNMHATGEGRFNANDVDLNRNFDCRWAPKSSWRSKTVSAGTEPFSEPEAQALRDYVLEINPEAAVFWHSMADNVYGSECGNELMPETLALLTTYGDAADYGKVPVFDAYPVTGAAEDWLASIGIAAITVELGSRTSIEWSQNLAGVQAVLDLYTE